MKGWFSGGLSPGLLGSLKRPAFSNWPIMLPKESLVRLVIGIELVSFRLRRARCFQVAFAFEREGEGDPSLEDFPLIPEETSTAEDPFSLFEVKMKVWGGSVFPVRVFGAGS